MIIINMLISIFSLSLVFIIIYFSSKSHFIGLWQDNIELIGNLAADYCATPVFYNYNSDVQDIISKLKNADDIVEATVFDTSGLVFTSTSKKSVLSLKYYESTKKGTQVVDDFMIYNDDILLQDDVVGRLIIITKMNSVKASLNKIVFQLILLMFVLLAIVVLLAAKFQNIISLPIIQMKKAMNKVAKDSNFSFRFTQAEERNDEFSELFIALNKLLEHLEKKEREQIQINTNLQQTRDLYTDFLHHMPMGIFMKNEDYKFSFVNKYLEEKHDAKEWIYKSEENIFPEKLHRDFIEHDEIASKKPHTITITLPDKYGDERIYEVFKFPLKSSDVNIIGGSFLDITERKNAENKIKYYIKELEKNNQELSEFNYVASHDLREPLRTITSYCDLLKLDLGEISNKNIEQDLHYITSATERMNVLIQDLLELSRAGRTAFKITEIDLNKIIKNVLEDLAYTINTTNAEIEILKLPVIKGDSTHLTRVFMNIIGNALKFQPRGNKPKIFVSTIHLEEWIVISISDNGIGIDPKFRKEVFKPFKRLHSSSEYQGTGMGLAICNKIMERHNGKVTIESELMKGSTISVWFPR